MQKSKMVLTALMLAVTVMLAVGRTKPDEPGNGGNGGNNGGNGGSGTYIGHEYVDLGLPSGTLWATCNVGASAPEGYGDYFAWGEITPKDTYNWSTYKYCNYCNGDYDKLTKYCSNSWYGDNGFIDNLTVLLPEDDAATANWGNGWCMPTADQWRELLVNTTNEWTTRNGVIGRLFTSKKNGQTLFLPAAGRRWDDELYNAGSDGHYWSSSLAGGPFRAWYFHLSWGDCYVYRDYSRRYGFTVRPVRSARQN